MRLCLELLSGTKCLKPCLGDSNRVILSVLSQEVIKNSYGQDYIAISDELYAALKVLRKFNFERIYTHPRLKVESNKVQRSYRILFEYLLSDFEKQEKNSYIWNKFLHNKSPTLS